MDNKSGKIFSLELNVGSFLGAIIAMFIYFLNSQQDIKSLVSIALSFAFPIYLLKVSRLYEQVGCNKDSFLKEILFPKLSKNDVKIYLITICKYLVLIAFFVCIALLFNIGLQNEANNLIKKAICCYSALALFIASSFLLMELVFDFLIGLILIGQKNSY